MPVAIELSPEEQKLYRRSHCWGAAIKAGLLAGFIVLLFPAGNPWTSLSFQNGGHIMGRSVTVDESVTMLSGTALAVYTAHLTVSVLYAMILLAAVYRLRTWRAIFAGIGGALVLYALNFAVYRAFAPELTGPFGREFNVAIAHLLFGGICAGAIRGFLRPPQHRDETQPNPGPQYR